MESGRFFGQVVNEESPYENLTLGVNETLLNATWGANETFLPNGTLMLGNRTELVENKVKGGHFFWLDLIWLCLLFLAVALFGVDKTVRLYASGVVARRRQATWRKQESVTDGHLVEI